MRCNNVMCAYNENLNCRYELDTVVLDFEGKCKSFALKQNVATVGMRIQELEDELGLTNREFAETIGVSDALVSLWKLDKRAPMVKYLITICNTHSVSADWLLTGRGNMWFEEEE